MPANEAFLRGLRERCDRHGILLVADEIQTGVGRTGRFWGHDHFRVRPDIVIIAKGLASGFRLSGMAAPTDPMRQGRPGSQGGTYGGNAVACAAALATLEVIEEEGLVARAARLGRVLASELNKLAAGQSAIGEVRGLGLVVGVEFGHRRAVRRTGRRPGAAGGERRRLAAPDLRYLWKRGAVAASAGGHRRAACRGTGNFAAAVEKVAGR